MIWRAEAHTAEAGLSKHAQLMEWPFLSLHRSEETACCRSAETALMLMFDPIHGPPRFQLVAGPTTRAPLRTQTHRPLSGRSKTTEWFEEHHSLS